MMLVDAPTWEARGRRWSHLASDTSYAELHAFAAKVGLHPFSYDGDHYDVPSERYDDVVAAGAVPCSPREILGRVQAAGLRFAKRRGERPLAAVPEGLPWLDASHRLDLLASERPTPPPSTVAVATYVTDATGRVLLAHSTERNAWEGPGGDRREGESPAEAAVRHLARAVGVHVPATRLRPCAHGRILLRDPAESRPQRPAIHLPTSHIAVYRVTLDAADMSTFADVGRARDVEGSATRQWGRVGWFTDDALPGLCGAQPWWPILSRLRLAAGSHQR